MCACFQCDAEEQGGFGGSQDGAGGERKDQRGTAEHQGVVGGRRRDPDRDGEERQHAGATGLSPGETLCQLSTLFRVFLSTIIDR